MFTSHTMIKICIIPIYMFFVTQSNSDIAYIIITELGFGNEIV